MVDIAQPQQHRPRRETESARGTGGRCSARDASEHPSSQAIDVERFDSSHRELGVVDAHDLARCRFGIAFDGHSSSSVATGCVTYACRAWAGPVATCWRGDCERLAAHATTGPYTSASVTRSSLVSGGRGCTIAVRHLNDGIRRRTRVRCEGVAILHVDARRHAGCVCASTSPALRAPDRPGPRGQVPRCASDTPSAAAS